MAWLDLSDYSTGLEGWGYSDTFIYSDQFWGFKILHFNIFFVFHKKIFVLFIFFFGGGGEVWRNCGYFGGHYITLKRIYILVGPWFATLIIKLQNNVLKLKVHINSYLLDKNNLFCCDFAWLAYNFTHSVISERSKNRAVNNSRHFECGTFDSRMWRH